MASIGQQINDVGKQILLTDESYTRGTGNPLNDFLRQVNQMIIFDPSIVDLTLGPDLFKQIAQAAAKLVTSRNPAIYRFFLNPTTLDYAMKKVVNPVLTKKGWESLQWPSSPNEMITMAFAGTTGALIPIKALRDQGVLDVKFSINWMRFQQFQQMYLEATNDLKMLYDGKLYEGYVADFQFQEDANKPFGINYRFVFMAYPDRIRNIAAPNTLFRTLPLASSIIQAGVNV